MNQPDGACNTAGPATPRQPQPEQAGTGVPPYLAQVLYILAILIAYGRHLAETLERRAAWRGFATVARCFGTGSVAVILAHLHRGIMRAVALQRMLQARAARGHDLRPVLPRDGTPRRPKPPAPAADAVTAPASPEPPATTVLPVRRAGPAEPLTQDDLPSMAELEAQVRRRPVGSSLVDICRDLGAAFGLCETSFGQRLFTAIRCFGGSLDTFMREMRRCERRFERAVQDCSPKLDWPEQSEAGIRRVLGFLIGETPTEPFCPALSGAAPAMAAATGPP